MRNNLDHPLTPANGHTRIRAHATVGGVLSVLQGGKFGHGFVSAGVSKALTPAISEVKTGLSVGSKDLGQALIAATVGGTVSKMTGGKFSNGAITAAFANLFNQQGVDEEEGLTQEQINNMSPADVVKYWKSGKGGHIDFGPDSEMAKIFSEGNGAKKFEKFVLAKHGSTPEEGLLVDKFAYTFTWFRASITFNSAEHVVGSWNNGVAISDGSSITYTIQNRMGLNSLMFGRQLNESFGIETVGKTASDLTMSISWQRDY